MKVSSFRMSVIVLGTAIAFPILAGTGGCARATHYRLVVEGGFSPAQVEQIFEAADNWGRAVPVTFDYVQGGCPDPLWDTICVRASGGLGSEDASGKKLEILGTTSRRDALGFSALVWIDVAHTPPEYFRRVAAHELGHAQGLVHHPEGTLMYYACDSESAEPSGDDVDQWMHLH